jgi:hypothetical protein
MTNGELIGILKKYPDDTYVRIAYVDDYQIETILYLEQNGSEEKREITIYGKEEDD